MDDMTSIDAPEIRAMGVAVGGVADRLERVAEQMRGWEHSGEGAVEGSRVCESELFGTALLWETTMAGLAGFVRDYGDQLRQAAGDFVTTDENAAHRFQSAGTPGA
ncbi:hypothetical protein JIG36_39655 [Actinoplanes sp. LDG1-06]|uniref:WXG100 family type VII secretion target n=1 Tax=Paractinoplanes ovalisporus TaxID=2810368 RepID=A0ABS2AQL8_9ACTN|nr:hypothetical protein [Actinoplanes ovalisporus]MBM2621638.1 hypothetical protein [Actinoplanes ovalisporus]